MARVTIRKPRPLFRPELRLAPGHPLGDRVLVREFPVESKTEGGLEIADVAKQHYFAGTLIAAGSAAVVSIYTIGYLNTEAGGGQYAQASDFAH